MADRNGATGPPTEALHYSDRDQKRDYRQGRADARKQLPLVPRQPAAGRATGPLAPSAADGEPAAKPSSAIERTPFLSLLFHERNQVLAELLQAHQRAEAGPRTQRNDANSRHEFLLEEQKLVEAALDALTEPLTDEEATRRHPGEVKANRSEEVVRQRRIRERQRKITAAQEELRSINRQLYETKAAAGRAQDAIDGMRDATRVRGFAISSHYEQRKASYLNGVAHYHQRGPELVRALELSDPGLPEWLSWTNEALEGV